MESSLNYTLKNIITTKVRIYLYSFSFISMFFLQTYCTNICPFIDGLLPNQVLRNLGFIFILHIIYRESLFYIYKEPKANTSLPRHAYYLSIISWTMAGISAFVLHSILYPDFPIGSHIKLFSSYLILGGAILSQLEYIIYEQSYKKITQDDNYTIFNEKLSKRILETFLIFTIAPLLTLLLVIGRYSFEGIIESHVYKEIFYISTIMVIAAIFLVINFKNLLKEDTRVILEDIINTQKEIIYTMGEIAETRSKETGNHVKRVAEYSKILALKLGLKEDEAELLKLASPMHDIGKVGIPDNILNKPGKLTKDEFEIMKTHAKLGFNMLKYSNKKILKAAAIVSHGHHEKYDGSGYPNGLKGEEIHIYARITAVADVFDALGSDRVYKKAWEDDKIWQLFRDESSKHFDPNIIDIFFENLDEILAFRDANKDK